MKQSKTDFKTTVAIFLRGDQLQPDTLSKVLGTQCTWSQVKGKARGGHKKGLARTGAWVLKAEATTASVASQTDELFAKVGSGELRLDKLEGVEDAFLDVLFASGDEPCESVEYSLTHYQLSELCRLGLYLRVTVM